MWKMIGGPQKNSNLGYDEKFNKVQMVSFSIYENPTFPSSLNLEFRFDATLCS